MGNSLSLNDAPHMTIKKLYRMNATELQTLKMNLTSQGQTYSGLSEYLKTLIDIQSGLKGKIPDSRFNNVDTCLKEIRFNSKAVPSTNPQTFNDLSLDDEEQQFRREQEERERQFYEKQKSRRNEYERDIKSFNMSEIDSLRLFKLDKNFSMDDLKIAYRNLARRYHPDRKDGSVKKFQVITKAYMALMEEVKMKQIEKTPEELKQESQKFFENQSANQKRNIKLKGKFDNRLFNKIYDENRLQDTTEQGYGNWIKENPLEEREVEKPAVFSKGFNINVFNNIFEKQAIKDGQVTEYKTPSAANTMTFNGIQEMGIDQVDNYSSAGAFSDLKEAHSMSNILHPGKVNRTMYKSMDQLKAEREKPATLTDKELSREEEHRLRLDRLDQERQINIQKRDELSFKHYNTMNSRMIEKGMLQ